MSPLLIVVCLGLIQGLCEFLPVSSSGHLVLAQSLFGLNEPEILFDLVLHLGTLTAVCVYYRKTLISLFSELRFLPGAISSPSRLSKLYTERPDFRLGLLIIAGSIPTAIIGLVFKDFFTNLFTAVPAVGLALLITGAFLLISNRYHLINKQPLSLTLPQALAIGLIQGLAIAPGLSRSGLTIGLALIFGLDRELAARYSFLLSVPAIVGGFLLTLESGPSSIPLSGYLAGFIVAVVSGYWALGFLVHMLKKNRFGLFSIWCSLAGLGTIITWFVNS